MIIIVIIVDEWMIIVIIVNKMGSTTPEFAPIAEDDFDDDCFDNDNSCWC